MLQLEPDDRARSSEPTTMGHLIIAGLFVAGAAHALVAGTHIYRTAARARVEALAVPVEKAIIRALDAAAIAHDRVPVEPDKMWVLPESTAFGVFYGFNVRIHDPVY
jgi:predicted naringenin-chalcone synthase